MTYRDEHVDFGAALRVGTAKIAEVADAKHARALELAAKPTPARELRAALDELADATALPRDWLTWADPDDRQWGCTIYPDDTSPPTVLIIASEKLFVLGRLACVGNLESWEWRAPTDAPGDARTALASLLTAADTAENVLWTQAYLLREHRTALRRIVRGIVCVVVGLLLFVLGALLFWSIIKTQGNPLVLVAAPLVLVGTIVACYGVTTYQDARRVAATLGKYANRLHAQQLHKSGEDVTR